MGLMVIHQHELGIGEHLADAQADEAFRTGRERPDNGDDINGIGGEAGNGQRGFHRFEWQLTGDGVTGNFALFNGGDNGARAGYGYSCFAEQPTHSKYIHMTAPAEAGLNRQNTIGTLPDSF